MYALPQIHASLGRWWQHVMGHLNRHQVGYHRDLEMAVTDLYRHWLDPGLFFSQTCGYPLTTVLKRRVKLIGTPVYDSDHCRQANYCSLLIVRDADESRSIEDFAGKRFTYNGLDSQSGFNAVKRYLADRSLPVPFFGQCIQSGRHTSSIARVSGGEADICAVDCVSYSLIQRHQPRLLENVRVLSSTGLTPGLPFITSLNTPDEIIQAIFDAIEQACTDEAMRRVNADLLIRGICKISYDTYLQSIKPATPQTERL